MPEVADTGSPAGERPGRSLTGFYVVVCVFMALVLLGAWLWTVIPKWPFGADEARRRQSQAAARLGLPVETELDLGSGVKLELVLIPAGRFDMGSPESSYEGPVHRVWITRPFYMGRHEVTQEVWEKVMGTNPSSFKGAKNPVENVSWDDCQQFLKKLNAMEKVKGTFRLPTEAEWEWACRAGTKTRFCSGDADATLADYAWHDANSGGVTHPVGAKKPNAWGLHDMHGNVREWCQDWYEDDYYVKSPKYDPTGPATGSYRVLRGGSWSNSPRVSRSSLCGRNFPACRDINLGFRVVVFPAGP